MLRGRVAAGGTAALHEIGDITKKELLCGNIEAASTDRQEAQMILQMDSDPEHAVVTKWLKDTVSVLVWPSQTLDLFERDFVGRSEGVYVCVCVSKAAYQPDRVPPVPSGRMDQNSSQLLGET